MTPHLDAVALLPEITFTALIGLVLIVDLMTSQSRKEWLGVLAIVGAGISLACVIGLSMGPRHATMAGGIYVVDNFSLFAKGFFLTTLIVTLALGLPRSWKGEYITLMLASVLGMVMVVSARDLLTFFVAFELLAIPGYMLTGWRKKARHGSEAALKYYLLGVFASGILLYGISLLFGLAGTTTFEGVTRVFAGGGDDIALARLAVLFVLVGMAFKVSAVPFHFWAPDAYQGAPIPVAAFLSVASKAAGLFALIELLAVALGDARSVWAPLLYGLAVLTMTVGNLVALRQTDLVRLLAYSSIAQAGYLLVPLALVGHGDVTMTFAISTVVEFLLIYAVMNLGAFGVVTVISRRTGTTAVHACSGLFHSAPGLAVAFAVFLLSLAGIPPFAGWFAKLVIFRSGIEAHNPAAIVLVCVTALNSAIGLVYYMTVIRQMWFVTPLAADAQQTENQSSVRASHNLLSMLVLGSMVAATLFVGVLPGIAITLGEWSSTLTN